MAPKRKFTHRLHRQLHIKIEKPISYQNLHLIKQCLGETGKLFPSNLLNITSKQQRQLTLAVKQARFLALIPYCDSHHH